MKREQFEEVAQQAFDSLPDQFRNSIENVHIAVEDYPSEDQIGRTRSDKYSLLGLYQGIPLTNRGTWYGVNPTIPDIITLFQKNIESVCRNEGEVQNKIVEVLFHEIGHYFGMDEKQIRNAMKDFQ